MSEATPLQAKVSVLLRSAVAPYSAVRAGLAREVVLSWANDPGWQYQVEISEDLQTWHAVGAALIGSGESLEFTAGIDASKPARFYRVIKRRP